MRLFLEDSDMSCQTYVDCYIFLLHTFLWCFSHGTTCRQLEACSSSQAMAVDTSTHSTIDG